MENEKIICSECSTENEQKYEYCKNCGAKLNRNETEAPSPTNDGNFGDTYNTASNSDNNQTHTQYSENQKSDFSYGNTFVESINGIPYGEVATFVGKQANKYMPVFSRLEITGGKTSWHWPCAILSFFLGPLGVALWYFYRKMYKHAAIFAGLGVLLSVVSELILGSLVASENFFESYLAFLMGEISENPLLNEDSLKYEVANLISSLIEITLAIVCGLFTHGWYKEHISKTILKYRASNVDMRYYQMGLMSLGGTSGGMLALGFAVMFFAENLSTIIFAAVTAMGG
ncbi:MAG: hypothetical protein E7561_03005 [Ruminococcaceae bacterium]|nr:hypothetical protein [Oscillospiraceae bacterium]